MFQKDGCNFLNSAELDYEVLIALKTHDVLDRTSSGKKSSLFIHISLTLIP